MSSDSLPEGTDSIIEDSLVESEIDNSGAIPMDSGAEADAEAAHDAHAEAPAAPSAKEAFADAKAKAGEKVADLKGQATDKLRAYAVTGKDKTTETIQGFSKLVEDAAAQIDDKVGAQYGDYARQAAQALAGFAQTIDGKDVDELFDQARDVVRKSPAIAIGAATAIGFVLSRVAKAGLGAGVAAANEASSPAPQDVSNDA